MCIIWRHDLGSGGLQSMPEVGVVLTEESHSGRPLRGFPRGTWGLRNSPSPPVPWISSSFSYLATAWLLRSRTGPWWLVIIITIQICYTSQMKSWWYNSFKSIKKKKKTAPRYCLGPLDWIISCCSFLEKVLYLASWGTWVMFANSPTSWLSKKPISAAFPPPGGNVPNPPKECDWCAPPKNALPTEKAPYRLADSLQSFK